METKTEICRSILYEFLERWTIDNVKNMTIEEYVSVGNKNTFCQWLETRTRELGSINGINSSKFGIYKRGNKSKKPKRLYNDANYSWQKFYGEDGAKKAFEKIRSEILQIIIYAETGEFSKIDNLHLTQFVKWKIAYLYSNERLIPIFTKDVLIKIAKHFGFEVNTKTPISEIQKIMIANKPSHQSIYEYSEGLFNKFRAKKMDRKVGQKSRRTDRGATNGKNTKPQIRKGAASYIATQRHNILQEALKNKLVKKYGEKNVFMEKNYVDIRVVQPNLVYFYEVKSSAYAGDCVREALGQIISYAHRDQDERPKKIIVAGQYGPNDDEINYIQYVKTNIKLDFDYEFIELV